MKRWITFDLDGTLMQNPFGKWVFPAIDGIVSGVLGAPFEAKRQLLAEHERLQQSGEIVAAYDWDAIVGRMMESLGLDVTIQIEELVLKHSHAPKIYLLDETVIPALRRLKQEGYALAAVTNGYYKYQYPVMKALGLTEWLDDIVTPERVGYAKPDVRMVEGLRRQGGVIAAHVGDRLDHDVAIANKLGVKSVLINRNMPSELTALSPKERTSAPGFRALLEQLAGDENPELRGAPLPDLYMPGYAIRDLDELAECLQNVTGETEGTGFHSEAASIEDQS